MDNIYIANVRDMFSYNFDIKISGNLVTLRKYDVSQIKNIQSKENIENENIKLAENYINIFEEWQKYLRMKSKNKYSAMIEYFKNNKKNKALEFLNKKLKDQAQKERFYQTNKRAKTQIIDLIACNHKKIEKYSGGYAEYTKFLTLTFSDLDIASDIKKVNAELTKFMKRVSYYLYRIKKNVLKYIAVPEMHGKKTDTRTRWHFHLVLFNAPYITQKKLQEIWGNGIIDIRAIKGTMGKVAKYVGKYLGKSHENKNGKVEYDDESEKVLSYEVYKKNNLMNMKRYSSSKGLKKPTKISVELSNAEYLDIFNMIFNKEFLTNKCNKINKLNKTEKWSKQDQNGKMLYKHYKNNKIQSNKVYGTERGNITYIDFELKTKYVKAFKKMFFDLAIAKVPTKKEKISLSKNEIIQERSKIYHQMIA